MEVVLSVLVYLFIIGCVLLLPFLLYISVFVFSDNRKKLAFVLAAVLLGAELICGGILYIHPIYICPASYDVYISEEQEDNLKAGNLPAQHGFWSANIPSLAIINQVTYAAEGCVEIRTWYFPFGSCETGVNFDGLYSIN